MTQLPATTQSANTQPSNRGRLARRTWISLISAGLILAANAGTALAGGSSWAG